MVDTDNVVVGPRNKLEECHLAETWAPERALRFAGSSKCDSSLSIVIPIVIAELVGSNAVFYVQNSDVLRVVRLVESSLALTFLPFFRYALRTSKLVPSSGVLSSVKVGSFNNSWARAREYKSAYCNVSPPNSQGHARPDN